MICIPGTDEEYFQWIDENPGTFIVNSDKASSDRDLPMIHTTACGHTNDRNWHGYTASATFKLCSDSKQELEAWMRQTDKRELKRCKSCAP